MEQDVLPKHMYISVTLHVVTSQEMVSTASVVRTSTLTKTFQDTHENLKTNFSLKTGSYGQNIVTKTIFFSSVHSRLAGFQRAQV